LYISSALTGGGAPAHPSPSPAGIAGGLNRAFKTPSFVWQIWQLFGPAAIVNDDGKKKVRQMTDHAMNFNIINTPCRSFRTQE
jgi:hypothetical protein